MKQRVMIAQSLAGDPDLIIADEPTTALDVTIEAQILDQLVELRDEFNVSIVLITHDLAVVRETCDRVMVMYAGELMETAPTEVLFADPYHPYTQGLLRSIPRVSDDQERLDVIEGTVPSPLDKPKGCPFRNRCAEAFEMCDEPLRSHEGATPGHIVQCHLYDDDAEKNRTETSQRRDGTTDKTSQHEQTDADSKRKLGRLDNPSEGGIR
jgi:peptide/nickel transport system ATP-binding protein